MALTIEKEIDKVRGVCWVVEDDIKRTCKLFYKQDSENIQEFELRVNNYIANAKGVN